MITDSQVSEFSNLWKIDRFTVLREYIQLVFLFHLYNMKGSESLFFKGGTAIRFLFGSFRFSEDLDFTSTLSQSRAQKLFGEAMRRSKRELVDVSLDAFQEKKYSFVSRLKYRSKDLSQPIGIHIEISMREIPITREVSPIETLFPISPYPLVTHISIEEILAEKVRALTKRKKGRDLFDIWYLFSKGASGDWSMVEEKMKFYKESVTTKQLISKIEDITEEEIKDDLNKFLPRNQRALIPLLKKKVIEKLS